MMTDIMHAHVKGPDLADPTGAKEEQLYVCRSAPPTPRVSPKSDHVESTRANQCKSVPQAKAIPDYGDHARAGGVGDNGVFY